MNKQKMIHSNKTKLWKKIDILVYTLIFVINLGRIIYINNINSIVNTFSQNDMVVTIALIIFLIFATIIISIPFIAIYFGIRAAIKLQRRHNQTFEVTHDLEYYREIFKGVSPATMSLLMNLEIETSKDIGAMILYYEQNNIIRYRDDKSIYFVDWHNPTLKNSDRDLLEFLTTGNQELLKSWKNKVLDENVQEGFIKRKYKNDKTKTGCGGFFAVHLILFIIFITLILQLNNHMPTIESIIENAPKTSSIFESIKYITNNNEYIKVFALALIFATIASAYLYTFLSGFLYIISTLFHLNKFKRTSKGNLLTEKLYGMKNFIHDFSNLQDATKEQLKLWNDFLIYTVVLEENNKILLEISQYIKINLLRYKNYNTK